MNPPRHITHTNPFLQGYDNYQFIILLDLKYVVNLKEVESTKIMLTFCTMNLTTT